MDKQRKHIMLRGAIVMLSNAYEYVCQNPWEPNWYVEVMGGKWGRARSTDQALNILLQAQRKLESSI